MQKSAGDKRKQSIMSNIFFNFNIKRYVSIENVFHMSILFSANDDSVSITFVKSYNFQFRNKL